ncbi:MAG: hypothetical protein ACK5B9_12905, partial [Flavobacteriia bacterium]
MKTLIKNEIYNNNQSSVCLIVIIKEKKIKISYSCYNANEKFLIEIFDGYKWNYFLDISDLGFETDKSMYIKNHVVKKQRFDVL